jgi:hypothetical protein
LRDNAGISIAWTNSTPQVAGNIRIQAGKNFAPHGNNSGGRREFSGGVFPGAVPHFGAAGAEVIFSLSFP